VTPFCRFYLAELVTTIWQHWRSTRYTQTVMSRCDLERVRRE